MRRIKKIELLILLIFLAGFIVVMTARLDWWAPVPEGYGGRFVFQENFEGAGKFADLFPKDASRWHGIQCEPKGRHPANRIELSSETVHSGKQAMRFVAEPYDGKVASKADLLVSRLRFIKGSAVWFSGWYYLAGGGDGSLAFLWDLEASGKWQSPGRRLYLQDGEWLASDLGKWWGGKTFRQPAGKEVKFPKDRWVHLKVHLVLSEKQDGVMEVWQDGVKLIDARGQTLPTAKAVYDRLEIGLTANGNQTHAQTLYVDDVVLSNEPVE